MTIDQALIMAAGHATRMRPLTDHLPKPLLEVGGLPLVTHIIDHLIQENVKTIVINGYHALQPLRDYVVDIRLRYPQCDFILSEEEDLLETGGGAVKALPYLNQHNPFYMINGDAFWVNAPRKTSLRSLVDAWTGDEMDVLLLLQPCQSMNLTDAVGDYTIDQGNHRAIRSLHRDGEYMFTGVRVCMPSVLQQYPCEKFSFLKIMDDCEKKGRLGGVVHEGEWYHISTPKDLCDVEKALFSEAS